MNTDSLNVKPILRQFLVQRFLTERFIRFTDEEGILTVLASMERFDMEKAVESFHRNLGYNLRGRIRLRMFRVLIDLLCECEYVKDYGGWYMWNAGKDLDISLKENEYEIVKNTFAGQTNFFEECIYYASTFLRGGPPLYSFDRNSTDIWEKFLKNAEFTFARSILTRLLIPSKDSNCAILDLCYGPGFDILQIQEQSPQIKVTALDYKDIFYNQASRRLLNPDSVKWVDSALWRGFGDPLPFDDNTFDKVLFTCADPYILEESREYVYSDIFRVLKRGGALGILTRSYPDPGRKYVKDTWIRRGILCHDFSESVCEGWHGFYDAHESIDLFKKIGYSVHTTMLNASIWRLDKS
jgi:ubiquinone/menaquinone biosynthesis C-methylase UbiE